MQWQCFRVPVNNRDAAEEEFNRFLRGHRVLAVHREFVAQGESSYWALAVEYLPGEGGDDARREAGKKEKVDYKELLSPEEFARFVRLREWRKAAAQAEAVPVYIILTNEQMAEIARADCRSLRQLGAIDGIGPGRLEKYGKGVLEVLNGGRREAGGESLPENH